VTRFKLTRHDDGTYELEAVPEPPQPSGASPLTKLGVAAVALALIALYGCGAHGSNATTHPAPTTSARSTR
jgi:hypothetical protein